MKVKVGSVVSFKSKQLSSKGKTKKGKVIAIKGDKITVDTNNGLDKTKSYPTVLSVGEYKLIKESSMKTYSEFINESASKAGKRILARALKQKLSDDWTIGGGGTLVAMADEDKASIDDAVKALSKVSGISEFKSAKLAGGKKANFDGGIVSVIVSNEKVRVEYA